MGTETAHLLADGSRPFWEPWLHPRYSVFFLCFTDYGIPASVGGEYDVVARVLYNEMLGSIPDFNQGCSCGHDDAGAFHCEYCCFKNTWNATTFDTVKFLRSN